MTAEATFYADECAVDATASAAVASGEITQLSDGRAAVYQGLNAAASGDKISLRTEGLFKVSCAAATTFSAGDPVIWDSSASAAVAIGTALDGSADFYLGVAVAASGSSQAFVIVDLNAIPNWRKPFVFEVDCETDTSEHTIIPANMNIKGLVIDQIFGLVSEVFAGGTQDQGIVTVNDEDDNVLATLTPSDAGADALNDIVVGYMRGAASTGAAAKIVAAGKSVYCKATQAVSGTSAAGKLKVYILGTPLV